MLVQFMLKNVLSFKEETILDMTAINAYKEHECNLIKHNEKDKFVKVAAIYGANASGKSNLYLAMLYFQNIIMESLNTTDTNDSTTLKKYYYPYSFEKNKENSEFQIIFIQDDYEYKYGFEYNSNAIVSEWLYMKNSLTNRTLTIFERAETEVDFGASVRKECQIYSEQIPREALVLTFFNKLKLKTTLFKSVYSGIMNTVVIPTYSCEDTSILQRLLPEVIDSEKENLVEFLFAIDTGIKDIRYEKIENLENEVRFITYHEGKDGNKYSLNLFNESEGTIKSIILYIYARIAILSNKSIFIDELNVKLHPLLLKFFIDLFYNNESKAQLIYTTHDTTLMDKRYFRRDQIWFVQKDQYGYSELTALSDFKVRSDASFEKDYLAGVYGGIPSFYEFDMKVGE